VSHVMVEPATFEPEASLAIIVHDAIKDRSVQFAPPWQDTLADTQLDCQKGSAERRPVSGPRQKVHVLWHDDPCEQLESESLSRGNHRLLADCRDLGIPKQGKPMIAGERHETNVTGNFQAAHPLSRLWWRQRLHDGASVGFVGDLWLASPRARWHGRLPPNVQGGKHRPRRCVADVFDR